MPDQLDQNITRVAGQSIFANAKASQVNQSPQREITSVTVVTSFESVRRLLSDKPLRRPNRTRPLEG